MLHKLFYILSIIAVTGACKRDKPVPFSPADFLTVFPSMPTNMGSTINSVYDDYNSTAPPVIGTSFQFCFSSNRNSKGVDFDIICKALSVFSDNRATLTVKGADCPISAVDTINTGSDQFGPYLINSSLMANNTIATLLYATNDAGNLDVKYIQYKNNGTNTLFSSPQSISCLNSAKDDAYPSVSKTNSCIYFCSNRGSDFDIYKVKLNTANSLLQNLVDTTAKPVLKDTVLSSPGYDDKCPFVLGNTLVFTSNRPGGQGGYDLYYSVYMDGKWAVPVNFGNTINSPADEYRPIVIQVEGFTNNFMIFSSDRAGGMGGFDLYYVGISNMINQNELTE